jgi:hypothetical protein
MRFEVALILFFWSVFLALTVLQQSSVLSDLEQLWASRLARARTVDQQLQNLQSLTATTASSSHVHHESAAAAAAAALLTTINKLSEHHAALDARVNKMPLVRLRGGDTNDAAAAVDTTGKTKKTKGGRRRQHALPPLQPMRTTCGDYGSSSALERLVHTAQDRIFEADAGNVLSSQGAVGSPLDGARMDRGLSELDAEIERALDHIESTMPEIAELWTRWFRHNGEPVPAPLFAFDAEPHVSEKVGRKLFEEALQSGDL